ncbi:MYXO-CTERM domain-containing protein [Halarchaeum rubridurum]|uniref:MYXO-CTERM domain-containing protein n=1 Tax=Halarchaeum rubridurum TaxID=489911 RepID=A0A830FYF7_9EURY|nr:COG1361 S-layer family protein [Halarchaeum rubridurum]MBP1954466.1 MYXO-CTERM domain-containing protein [Halarchaeum rubridurum]GGM61230.1 hypothetical protein GCM10009017_09220 [Halarchaeum rubridurum]
MFGRPLRTALLGAFLACLLLGSSVAGVAPVGAQQAGNSGQVIGNPELDVFTNTKEFEPGTEATLRLGVSNRGDVEQGGPSQYEQRVTTARGLTVDARAGSAPIEVNTGTVGVGNVPTGTSPVDPIGITVSDDADPGTYRVPITLSYAYTRSVSYDAYGAEYRDFEREETQYVTVRVRDQARFAVVNRSTSAQVGSTGSLSVTVENVGTRAASEASATATSRSDELTFGSGSASSTAQLGAWEPGERRTVEYVVGLADDAALREYTVDLAVDYTDHNGIARTSQTLNVGVDPRAEQAFALDDVSTSLRVGEDGTLRATVVNTGPDPVRDPVVRFSSNDPNVHVDSAEYALGDLAPGERAPVSYTVAVSDAASASVQQFTLTVEYRNQRGDVERSDGLTTNAEVAPQRDRFVVAVANDTVRAGGSRALTVRVTNNGDEPLRNVEAKAFVQDPLGSDDDEGIVPSLAPGETDEFTIALSAGGSALEKRYPVSVDFQYELPDGDTEVSRTYTVPVTVAQSSGGGPPLTLVGGAVLVVAVVGFVLWRRRRE